MKDNLCDGYASIMKGGRRQWAGLVAFGKARPEDLLVCPLACNESA